MRAALLLIALLLAPLLAGQGPARAAEMVETTLYFGLANANGETVVHPSRWKDFLAEEVTPRFPDGFTVVDAQGQWKTQWGRILREETRLLIIVHARTQKAAQDIAALKAVYVKRFNQTSVLHTESSVKVVE